MVAFSPLRLLADGQVNNSGINSGTNSGTNNGTNNGNLIHTRQGQLTLPFLIRMIGNLPIHTSCTDRNHFCTDRRMELVKKRRLVISAEVLVVSRCREWERMMVIHEKDFGVNSMLCVVEVDARYSPFLCNSRRLFTNCPSIIRYLFQLTASQLS